MQISVSLNIMLYQHDMLNKNSFMMLFTAMYFSCSVSVDNTNVLRVTELSL